MSAVKVTSVAAETWTARTIGDTGKYVNGLAFKPTDWGDEGMPIIRIQNLTNPAKPLNRTTRAVDSAYVVSPGDILVSWSATLDAFIWDREPALLNQHIFKVVPDTSVVTKKFLFYTLKKAIAEMIKSEHLHGSTMKHINRGPFLAHKIEVPTLKEQDEIVAELEKQFSRLDDAVANLQRVKANLKRYKASVLKAAVEGRLVETEASIARREGRTYETGEQLLQRILGERRESWKGRGKCSQPIGPVEMGGVFIPDGWVATTIPQIATIASGNTPAGILDLVQSVGDVPWFKVGDMNHEQNQASMTHADAWLTESEVESLGLRIFPPKTVLFPKRGGAIATNKKRLLESSGAADLNVMGITPFADVAAYFFMWFEGVDLAKLSDGSNVPQINHKDIEPLIVPLPPIAEQMRVVAEVDRHLSTIREVDAEIDINLQRALALRQATLARTFFAEG